LSLASGLHTIREILLWCGLKKFAKGKQNKWFGVLLYGVVLKMSDPNPPPQPNPGDPVPQPDPDNPEPAPVGSQYPQKFSTIFFIM